MRESDERRFFGSDMIFIYDPNDTSNRPVTGLHNNVIRRWEALPQCLREQFVVEFSRDKLYTNPQLRLIEAEWVRLLQSAQTLLIICPHCREQVFVQKPSDERCGACGRVIQVKAKLTMEGRTLPLIAGNHYELLEGICFDAVLSSTDNFLWLRNTSKLTWQITTTKGEQRSLAPQALMPAKQGIQIQFNPKITAIIH